MLNRIGSYTIVAIVTLYEGLIISIVNYIDYIC